ncbi:MAG: hypothetical protein IPM87_17385 [Novosphingobium sp.]|nr:hypothetical protein [Novosphingobium sp.]
MKPPTTTTAKIAVARPRYLSMNALIGAPNRRNSTPTIMKLIERLTIDAPMKIQTGMAMNPAVIVSSLKGIGVAPLIMMISAPYSRR